MTTRAQISPWFPFGTAPGAAMRLFCLPHAGTGASAYRGWGDAAANWITVCPVQPPGREGRLREQPFHTAGSLAAELAEALLDAVDGPYALFGHSTGAICAFELCRAIRRRGGPQPAHLFVSGRRAPQLPEVITGIEEMSLDEFAQVLRSHGGTPDWVLDAPGMLQMIHPLMVADFAVSERYRYQPEEPLDVAITAFAADRDLRADPEQVAAWEAQTNRTFSTHRLEGGHFAIFDAAAEVHNAIAGKLCGRHDSGDGTTA